MNSTSLTKILDDVNGGDEGAFSRLAQRVYAEFKGIAHKVLSEKGLPDNGTLGATVLVDDVLIELRNQRNDFVNREQFFALATTLMFRLIERSRRDARALKRGGGLRPVALESDVHAVAKQPEAPDPDGVTYWLESMNALLHEHPESAEVVTLCKHCGVPIEKVAELTSMSTRTVERRLQLGLAYLADRLKNEQ